MMWKRRGLNVLIRHGQSILHSSASVQCPRTLPRIHTISAYDPLPMQNFDLNIYRSHRNLESLSCIQSKSIRHFSYRRRNSSEHDDEDEADEVESGEEDEGEMEESSDEEGECNDVLVSNCSVKRVYSVEEKEKESAAIGYQVIGPLDSSERPFKAWEPVFAVVQIGSHQFKVSNGDCIYTERLKFCEVNDKLILNRVLILGTSSQTIIGRPTLPEAAVHAVVEEHALDAKVIIFKKKRRKNYRRTKGHRQELTKLRITDIQGIEKPEKAVVVKPEKTAVGKPEETAVEKPEKVALDA